MHPPRFLLSLFFSRLSDTVFHVTLFFSDVIRMCILLKHILKAVVLVSNNNHGKSKSNNDDDTNINANSHEILENIKRYYKIEETQDEAPFREYLKKTGFIY
jgi:hypothetical protein